MGLRELWPSLEGEMVYSAFWSVLSDKASKLDWKLWKIAMSFP